MTGRSLYGDPALVALLRTQDQASTARQLIVRAARCWNHYGLADGGRNPTSGAPTGVHYSFAPSESAINEALNAVIRPYLPPDDHWLLDIPRVLLPGTASARMLVSRSGGVALGLPWVSFGGLFFYNEVLITLQLEHAAIMTPGAGAPDPRRRRTHESLQSMIGDGLPVILRHWVTGDALPPRLATEAKVLEMALDVWRHDRGRFICSYVWAVTLIQQILMLLHELGHVSRAAEDPQAGMIEHDTDDLEEVLADVWGSECLRALYRGVLGQRDGLVLSQAISVLFGILDEYGGHGSRFAQRCAGLMGILDPIFPADANTVTSRWQALRDLMERPGLLSACYENLASFLDMVSPDNGFAISLRATFPDDGVARRIEEQIRIQHGRRA